MFRYFGFVMPIALSSAIAAVGPPSAHGATTSTTLDILTDRAIGGTPADNVEIGNLKPLVRPNPNEGRTVLSGNLLWSVPLSALSATQTRPIFSISRRPPRAAAGPRIEVAPPVVPAPAAPERPSLALIGAVVGENDAIAVFLDQTSQGIVRLRLGDASAGWTLSSIQPREVTLKKGEQTESLVLQRSEAAALPSVTGGRPTPVFNDTSTPYAPFTPRFTRGNGQPDGL
jgi:general secretion pathway protein N